MLGIRISTLWGFFKLCHHISKIKTRCTEWVYRNANPLITLRLFFLFFFLEFPQKGPNHSARMLCNLFLIYKSHLKACTVFAPQKYLWIEAVSDNWLDEVMKSLTCSFLAGVLCPAAAGSCCGWFWGEVGSASLDFPLSVSLFSCGCLASESAPDSVVMVNHAGKEERGGEKEKTRWVSWLVMNASTAAFQVCVTISSSFDANAGMWILFDSKIKSKINVNGSAALGPCPP